MTQQESWLEFASAEGGAAADDDLRATDDAARLESRLEFGTAGLRGLMGPGFDRMNVVTVVQTTQGFCAYLEDAVGTSELKRRGVAIGYDARLRSRDFARAAAAVFVSRGVPVALMGDTCPTPLLATAVDHANHAAGIMVTASHNPKAYNGYKVYWGNGCQIIPPHDEGISRAIDANLARWDRPASDALDGDALVSDTLARTADAYYAALVDALCFRGMGTFRDSDVRAAYTPLHGVGAPWAERALRAFGLPAAVEVPEQMAPDSDFPTVTFPNPEEGAETWDLCFAAAKRAGAQLALANDPDVDRLAAAEWDEAAQAYVPFTGNEIGVLLGHWVWTEYKRRNPDADPSKHALLCSTVSSKMLRAVAEAEGLHFEETLTGFKWLGNRARDLEAGGVRVLFAFEEAIGYSFPFAGTTPDKDGVAALAAFYEMAAALRADHGKSVREHLHDLYGRYGAFAFRQGYIVSEDPSENVERFKQYRAKYARTLGGCKVVRVRDMGEGLDGTPEACDAREAEEPSLPWTRGELMITWYLEGGGEVTLRASGTEPKLKWYLEARGDAASAAADALAEGVRRELLS